MLAHGPARGRQAAVVCSSTKSHGSSASSQTTVVERRAADVLIIGRSTLAAATALSLARRGKKVIHLGGFGLQAPGPDLLPRRPLHLPALDAHLVE